MKWALTALFVAIVLILSIVNATRIERLRADLNTSSSVTIPETESLLVRGANGDRIPKTAFWVQVKPDQAPDSDVDDQTLKIDTSAEAANTDHALFNAAVASGRVTHVYRPDQRELFTVETRGGTVGTYKVQPVANASSVRFVAPGMTGDRKMTVVGLPQGLVSSMV